MTEGTGGAREISSELVAGLLGYLEAALGCDAVIDLLAELPDSPSVEEITASHRWVSEAYFDDLVRRVSVLTNDSSIGRQVGLSTYRALLGTTTAETLIALGSVEAAIGAMTEYGSKMSVGRRYVVVEQGQDHVVIEAVHDGVRAGRYSCDLIAGYYGALPGLFGMLGTACEPSCQARGDDHCFFRVSWIPDRSIHPEVEPEDRAVRGLTSYEQIESHHQAAADLVKAEHVTDVLDRIVTQVSISVRAPQFLLTVRLPGDPEPRVHSLGMDPSEAATIAASLARGDDPPADAVSSPIHFQGSPVGHLLALLPNDMEANRHDERMLASYAGYATSALEIVAALESARTSRDTATALLDLARDLAKTDDVAGVAHELAVTLATVVGCELAAVWIHDPEAEAMLLTATSDRRGCAVDTAVHVLEMERPSMPEVMHQHLVQFVQIDDLPEAGRLEMEHNGLVEAALVPIMAHESLVGMATAGFAQHVPPDRRAAILELIQGTADQAATAFANAKLLEQVRHQALHDDLTGLPRRSLAEDRCTLALARTDRSDETVAVLFIDLDGFKEVNDSYGHSVGDALLCEVASRIQHQLRAADTCARLGGDEFLVVISTRGERQGVAEVAERLLALFRQPFTAGDHTVSISASIGVACAAEADDTFEQLLQRSDAAMYQAKQSGKAAYVIGP